MKELQRQPETNSKVISPSLEMRGGAFWFLLRKKNTYDCSFNLSFIGIMEYMDCRLAGLRFPLTVLIDYLGYRLMAESILPIDRSTLGKLYSFK